MKTASQLKKCDKCEIEYPADLIQPCVSNAKSSNVCGICALELCNEVIAPSKRETFNGPLAESMRLKAIEWRKRIRN